MATTDSMPNPPVGTTAAQPSGGGGISWPKVMAIGVGLGSGVSLAIFSLTVKLLNMFQPWAIIFCGHGATTVFVSAALVMSRMNPFISDLLGIQGFKFGVRGFCHTFTHALEIFSLQNMPIGNASVILFSTPIYVALFGFLFLRERLTRLGIACVIANFLGSILVAKPEFIFGYASDPQPLNTTAAPTTTTTNATLMDMDNPPPTYHAGSYTGPMFWPIISAFAANILDAGDMVLVRDSKEYHIYIVMFYQNVIPFATSALILAFTGYIFPIDSTTLVPFLGFIAIHLIDEFIFTHAFQISDAAVGSLLRSTEIVWAYVFQVLVFGQVPEVLVVVGALIVVVSVTLLTLEEFAREHEFDSIWQMMRGQRNSGPLLDSALTVARVSVGGGEYGTESRRGTNETQASSLQPAGKDAKDASALQRSMDRRNSWGV